MGFTIAITEYYVIVEIIFGESIKAGVSIFLEPHLTTVFSCQSSQHLPAFPAKACFH